MDKKRQFKSLALPIVFQLFCLCYISPIQSIENQEPDAAEMAAWTLQASQAAQNYVKLIDQKKVSESWLKGAELFQKTVYPNDWAYNLELNRYSLGEAQQRTLKSQKLAWDP